MNDTKKSAKDEIRDFIVNWHDFPLDYWWRKKYNIPFGSQRHRSMSFIDMYVEYQEELLLRESERFLDEKENEEIGLINDNDSVVKMSKKEVDEEYDNLDLSNF